MLEARTGSLVRSVTPTPATVSFSTALEVPKSSAVSAADSIGSWRRAGRHRKRRKCLRLRCAAATAAEIPPGGGRCRGQGLAASVVPPTCTDLTSMRNPSRRLALCCCISGTLSGPGSPSWM